MASESSDERGVAVSLSPDVDEWLDAKAGELDVDRETVVVQLLAAYRAAAALDDEPVEAALSAGVEREVEAAVADRVPDVGDAVTERLQADDAEAVEDSLAAELDRLERDFGEKLRDVRERVVQVKRETDAKAPADHGHPEFEDLASLANEFDELRARVAELDDRVDDLAAAVDAGADERADLAARVDDLAALTDRLADAEEKLRTVAWAVSDLREAVDDRDGTAGAVDRLKRSAAEADVDRALCEHCENPVDIALLSEPTCPHCDATVSDVQPADGFFGKPRLTVAQRLEAGDATDSDVPDAARR